jgi:hypothetical protein
MKGEIMSEEIAIEDVMKELQKYDPKLKIVVRPHGEWQSESGEYFVGPGVVRYASSPLFDYYEEPGELVDEFMLKDYIGNAVDRICREEGVEYDPYEPSDEQKAIEKRVRDSIKWVHVFGY